MGEGSSYLVTTDLSQSAISTPRFAVLKDKLVNSPIAVAATFYSQTRLSTQHGATPLPISGGTAETSMKSVQDISAEVSTEGQTLFGSCTVEPNIIYVPQLYTSCLSWEQFCIALLFRNSGLVC
jgi:hypothetical protein